MHKIRRGSFILFLLFFIAFPLALLKNVQATQRVVAFGDSITAGWPYQTWNGDGCTNCGAYEPILQNYFNWTYQDKIVLNYGVPGELAGDGYNRIDRVMSVARPQYVLLMEGTNDLTFFVDPYTVAYTIYNMASRIYLWGAIPIVATITPDTRGGADWKNVGFTNELIKYYAGIDPTICLSDQSAAILPYWNYGYNYDGLHPNWWGYYIMALTWFSDLTTLKQCYYQ